MIIFHKIHIQLKISINIRPIYTYFFKTNNQPKSKYLHLKKTISEIIKIPIYFGYDIYYKHSVIQK